MSYFESKFYSYILFWSLLALLSVLVEMLLLSFFHHICLSVMPWTANTSLRPNVVNQMHFHNWIFEVCISTSLCDMLVWTVWHDPCDPWQREIATQSFICDLIINLGIVTWDFICLIWHQMMSQRQGEILGMSSYSQYLFTIFPGRFIAIFYTASDSELSIWKCIH